jgi:hypothetical protein
LRDEAVQLSDVDAPWIVAGKIKSVQQSQRRMPAQRFIDATVGEEALAFPV